jgi:hypothetical protein
MESLKGFKDMRIELPLFVEADMEKQTIKKSAVKNNIIAYHEVMYANKLLR